LLASLRIHYITPIYFFNKDYPVHRNFLLLLFLTAPLSAGVLINEISFDQPVGSPDWVELYNPGPEDVSVDGWILDDKDAAAGKQITLHLSGPLPPGSFLVVYVDASGEDETDFSDGKGRVYSGTATTVSLAATEDELYLRDGEEILDFVAWSTDGRYDGTADATEAVSAGLWPSGKASLLQDAGSDYSLGRGAEGEDSDGPSDFIFFAKPTPGDANRSNAPVDPPSSVPRGSRVVINEIAWGGTSASSSDEWVELFNADDHDVSLDGWVLRSGDGDLEVPLAGVIPSGRFHLLERTGDDTVSDIPSDRVYSGSLSNEGEDLLLVDSASSTVDAVSFSVDGWPAGSAAPEAASMERVVSSADGSLWLNWRSNDGNIRAGVDAKGNGIRGTPRMRNSVDSLFLPASAEACGNGLDDDADGAVDCGDSNCASGSACLVGGESSSFSTPLGVDRGTNPFSPDDPDPSHRSVRLHVNAGRPDVVKTLRVTDSRGETVRVLIDGDSGGWAGIASGKISWDGRDDQGRLCPLGIYIVHFEGMDPAGGRTVARSTVVFGGKHR
jgi:hypothetical protein